jgi:putative ABC transport system permease protein
MQEVTVGWWGLVASLTMVILTVGISLFLRLKLERDLTIATGRSIGQLVIAGWALTLILKDETSIIWAWLWVSAMIPFAAISASRREQRLPGLVWTTASGYLLGLGISFSVLFALQILPLESRVLVPIAGMIVGNSLRVVVVAATRLVDAIRDSQLEIEAMLSLGFTRHKAVKRTVSETLKLSLIPQIETTRTVGIIFLPGILTGLILAGVDPLEAALMQAVILFLILGSAAITGLIVVLFGAQKFLTTDHRLEPPEL